jgi:hypothetical protein
MFHIEPLLWEKTNTPKVEILGEESDHIHYSKSKDRPCPIIIGVAAPFADDNTPLKQMGRLVRH